MFLIFLKEILPNNVLLLKTCLFLNVDNWPHSTRDIFQIWPKSLPTICKINSAFSWLPWRGWSSFCSFPSNSCYITCRRIQSPKEQHGFNLFSHSLFPLHLGNFLIYQISKLAVLLHTRRKSHIQSNTLPLQQAGAIVMHCSPIAAKLTREEN